MFRLIRGEPLIHRGAYGQPEARLRFRPGKFDQFSLFVAQWWGVELYDGSIDITTYVADSAVQIFNGCPHLGGCSRRVLLSQLLDQLPSQAGGIDLLHRV